MKGWVTQFVDSMLSSMSSRETLYFLCSEWLMGTIIKEALPSLAFIRKHLHCLATIIGWKGRIMCFDVAPTMRSILF
ncbi:hypothetical protein Plhal304r1_c085g0169031 [Plasmopara halstedii]